MALESHIEYPYVSADKASACLRWRAFVWACMRARVRERVYAR